MIITWYGQSCFKLQNSQQVVLIDPYSPRKYGLRGPNFKADIVILTNHEDKKIIQKNLKQECFLISSPGEYEVRNIFVYGIRFTSKRKDLIIYQFEMDDIRFGVLGEIDSLLNNEIIEKLDGIDVLFIPIGGKDMIDSKKAVEIINSLEPKIAIPCCFKITGLKTNLFSLNDFLKEMGIKNIEKLNKLLLHKKNLPSEETKIVVLESRG